MAMDSAVKRAGTLGTARPWMRSQWVDAAKGREWRATVGNAYPVSNFQSPAGVSAQLLLLDGGLHGGLR